MLSADDIVAEWSQDPERPLFLLDETRSSIASRHDELIVFTCVSLRVSEAQSFLEQGAFIRNTLAGPLKEESFKGKNLARPELQKL